MRTSSTMLQTQNSQSPAWPSKEKFHAKIYNITNTRNKSAIIFFNDYVKLQFYNEQKTQWTLSGK